MRNDCLSWEESKEGKPPSAPKPLLEVRKRCLLWADKAPGPHEASASRVEAGFPPSFLLGNVSLCR